ncbi:hypothetical protein GN956_G23602 [Arapaima gigas]
MCETGETSGHLDVNGPRSSSCGWLELGIKALLHISDTQRETPLYRQSGRHTSRTASCTIYPGTPISPQCVVSMQL